MILLFSHAKHYVEIPAGSLGTRLLNTDAGGV